MRPLISPPVNSKHFETLYDSESEVGAHYNYTVLQATIDHGRHPKSVDFVALWEDERDLRLVEVAERLFLFGMLSDVRFLSVSQGTLSIYIYADKKSKLEFEKKLRAYRICERIGVVDPADPNDGDTWFAMLHMTKACGAYRPERHESESIGVKLTGIAHHHVLGVQDIEVVPPRPSRRAR